MRFGEELLKTVQEKDSRICGLILLTFRPHIDEKGEETTEMGIIVNGYLPYIPRTLREFADNIEKNLEKGGIYMGENFDKKEE